MASETHNQRVLYDETDAIFGLDGSNPTRTIVRDPSLLAVLNWSPRSTITAICPALSAKLDLSPQNVSSHATASFLSLQQDNPQPFELDVIPAALVHLGEALHLAPTAIVGGPTYMFPATASTNYKMSLPPSTRLLKSCDSRDRAAATSCHRPSSWNTDEWDDLISCAAHHPWAMIITDASDPVCICHTPAHNEKVVEAGIWTREDFRGQGLAPTAVAAWSGLHEDGTAVLYSTGIENQSSKSVARKLGLVELGYIWKLLAGKGEA